MCRCLNKTLHFEKNVLYYNHKVVNSIQLKGGNVMTENELLKISVEEFSRLQRFMLLADKDSEVYKAMKQRYIDLKVILTVSGVNLTELDRIKE